MDRLKENRSKMNTENGYGALTPSAGCLNFIEEKKIQSGVCDYILLASDGFMSAADTYKIYSREDMIDAALSVGLEGMVYRTREVERSDPEARRYARLKPEDDASAILLVMDQ